MQHLWSGIEIWINWNWIGREWGEAMRQLMKATVKEEDEGKMQRMKQKKNERKTRQVNVTLGKIILTCSPPQISGNSTKFNIKIQLLFTFHSRIDTLNKEGYDMFDDKLEWMQEKVWGIFPFVWLIHLTSLTAMELILNLSDWPTNKEIDKWTFMNVWTENSTQLSPWNDL